MGPPLKVTIVGAGIAGAMAARVLREKHEVTMLERFGGGHELGAAIVLGPTATKILQKYGFDQKRCGCVLNDGAKTYDQTGKLVAEFDMTPFVRMVGSYPTFQHRADLWDELMRLATAPSEELGIGGKPATVRWDADVVSVDVESGEVTLADGSKITSDLVIGADGIKSTVRPLVIGDEAFMTARPSGTSAFRFTLPRDLVDSIAPGLPVMDNTKNAVIDVHLALDGSNRSIVKYPCRSYNLLNFVCIAPDSHIGAKTTESWSAQGSLEDLLATYHDYDQQTLSLIRQANNIKLWQLRDQDPLPSYVKGRTVLVGDAAHAMTPHQAQGGTQSIEDGEGFKLFNHLHVDRTLVPSILRDFDSVRRPRASRIQMQTREAQQRRDPDKIYNNTKYNFTYPGVEECLSRLKTGSSMDAA